MKKLVLNAGIIVFLMLAGTIDADSQQRFESAEDSIRCLRNYSLYREYFRQGDIERALPYWRIMFDEFPNFNRNIYINGEAIFNQMIEEEDDAERRAELLDSAMLMFDQRMEYFEDEANVYGRKGIFYLRHNDIIEEAGPGYEALGKAIELGNMSSPVVTLYMHVTVAKFRADLLDNNEVINTYLDLTDRINHAIDAADNENLLEALDLVEELFAESGAADCDALIDIFADRVKESPDDEGLISMVNELLDDGGCTESDLFYYTTERLHELDPSARSAMNLARMYRSIEDFDRVIEFLYEAIELEEDNANKSRYYLELAEITNRRENNPQKVREYARLAIDNDDSNGHAYMLIGQLYVDASDCFDDDFESQTRYWAAVDQFIKAKNADPSIASTADKYIEAYEARFPDGETLFFHGYEEGEPYTVGCWINERTRIRAR